MDPKELRESVQYVSDLARLKELALNMHKPNQRCNWLDMSIQRYFHEKDYTEFRNISLKYAHWKSNPQNFFAVPEEVEIDGQIYPTNWRIYSADELSNRISGNIYRYTYDMEELEKSPSLSYLKSKCSNPDWSHQSMEYVAFGLENLHLVHPLYLKMRLYLNEEIDTVDVLFKHNLLN